jgi:hypothetical protein
VWILYIYTRCRSSYMQEQFHCKNLICRRFPRLYRSWIPRNVFGTRQWSEYELFLVGLHLLVIALSVCMPVAWLMMHSMVNNATALSQKTNDVDDS